MRFYCSEWNEMEWDEAEISPGESEEQFIIRYCKDEFWVYDCDGSSDEHYYFATSTGNYYCVYHDFTAYRTYNDEEDCHEFEVINEFTINKISKKEAKKNKVTDDRNYLKLIYKDNSDYWPEGWKELKEKFDAQISNS